MPFRDGAELLLLKKIKLMRDRVEDWKSYPSSVPSIASLEELVLRSRICFFAAKMAPASPPCSKPSRCITDPAARVEPGNFRNDSAESNHTVDPLVSVLRLSFDQRTGAGYFLRAESFFNTVSYMDELDQEEAPHSARISAFYGCRSLHTRSHGETLFKLLELKFQRNGLFLLDESEAALSPQRRFFSCSSTTC